MNYVNYDTTGTNLSVHGVLNFFLLNRGARGLSVMLLLETDYFVFLGGEIDALLRDVWKISLIKAVAVDIFTSQITGSSTT